MAHAGNSLSELETSKGHYLCNMRLKPIVQRFKLPEGADAALQEGNEAGESKTEDEPSANTTATAEDAVPGSTSAPGTAAGAGIVYPPGKEGYSAMMPGAGTLQTNGGSSAVDSMMPLV